MLTDIEKDIYTSLRSQNFDSLHTNLRKDQVTVPDDVILTWNHSSISIPISYRLREVHLTNANSAIQVLEVGCTFWNTSEQKPEHTVTVITKNHLELSTKAADEKLNENEVVQLRRFTAARVRVVPGTLDVTILGDKATWSRLMVMSAFLRSLKENGGIVTISSRTVLGAQGVEERELIWEVESNVMRRGKRVVLIEVKH